MRRIPLLIKTLFLADFVLGSAYLANQLAGNPRPGLSQFIDLNGEANLPAWFSSMQLFLSGVFMVRFVRPRVSEANRTTWVLLLLPAVLFALSCDEVAQIHERLGGHLDVLLPGGKRAGTMFALTGIWMFVLGVPFIVFMSWLVWSVRGHLLQRPAALTKFIVGFAVLLCGALVVDGLSNALAIDSARFTSAVLVEEMLEMVGGTIICWSSFEFAALDVVR